VLRQQAGLGRLPGKLVDALEPLVVAGGAGRPPVPGRTDGNGLRPAGEPEDPEDPSSRVERHLPAAATQPALSL
jgi:hypothetical protein